MTSEIILGAFVSVHNACWVIRLVKIYLLRNYEAKLLILLDIKILLFGSLS